MPREAEVVEAAARAASSTLGKCAGPRRLEARRPLRWHMSQQPSPLLLLPLALAALAVAASAVSLVGHSSAASIAVITEAGKRAGVRIDSCELCRIMFYLVDDAFQANATEKDIVALAERICIFLRIEDRRVCQAVVLEFENELLDVILKGALTPEQACGFLIGTSCATPYSPKQNWTVALPPTPKPPVVPPAPPQPGSPTVRVLHISDLHYDVQYTPGANAICGEPLCCRSSDGPPVNQTNGAWKFGDYRNCDTPIWTIESMFQHAAETGKFDVIYWTGDLPAHNVWNQSRSDQVTLVQTLTQLLMHYFPDKLIFAAVGNHESSPVNSFPQPYVTGDEAIGWLYDALATSWLDLGVPSSAGGTIAYGAFYVVHAFPGLRVVSLNMNYCTFDNWWLYLNATDPAGMLQWLVGQLDSAEKVGDKVHIIGHHHPSDCFDAWGNNYHQIINRYESTVTGQFFGHSHTDSYEVFYEDATSRPFAVAYATPSVTAYSGLNSGYRIYTVDGNYTNCSWVPLDYETYILDLELANRLNQAIWTLEYTAKTAYPIKDLLPASWEQLTYGMATNRTLFDEYYKFYYKSNLPSEPCDESCWRSMLCETMVTVGSDSSPCGRLPGPSKLGSSGAGDATDAAADPKTVMARKKRSLC